MAVTADLDLIIQLDAIFDNRVGQCTTVDSRIGTDLDIVTDNDAACLGNLDPDTIFIGKTEAFTSDDVPQDAKHRVPRFHIHSKR